MAGRAAGPTECVCCGARQWRPYTRVRDYDLVRCGECGFVRAVLPPEADVEALYDEDYFWGRVADERGLIPEALDPNPVLTAYRRYWLRVLADATDGPGRLLDIGCGAGALLDVARDEGWQGQGQEIAEAAAAEVRARGHSVCLGTLESCRLTPGSFDAATMIEVIEHLVDPRETLTAARRLLRTGGVLLVTTGDVGSLRARVRRSRWGYYRPPVHVSYYTREALVRMLHRCGFTSAQPMLTYNLAHPSLPPFGVPTSPTGVRAARLLRRTTRMALNVLAVV